MPSQGMNINTYNSIKYRLPIFGAIAGSISFTHLNNVLSSTTGLQQAWQEGLLSYFGPTLWGAVLGGGIGTVGAIIALIGRAPDPKSKPERSLVSYFARPASVLAVLDHGIDRIISTIPQIKEAAMDSLFQEFGGLIRGGLLGGFLGLLAFIFMHFVFPEEGETSVSEIKTEKQLNSMTASEVVDNIIKTELVSLVKDCEEAHGNGKTTIAQDNYILNRYHIVKKLGEGGAGAVYLCVDKSRNDQLVAVKIVKGVGRNEDSGVRFQRETETMRDFDHPNIIKCDHSFVSDWSDNLFVDKDDGVIVMEYVEGVDLNIVFKALKAEGKLLDQKVVLAIAHKIAEALQAAHHTIHRDIKPHNIFLGVRGEIKLGDFGRVQRQSDVTMTQAGMIAGTMLYIAPEQATYRLKEMSLLRRGIPDHKVKDHRIDIYSLGTVLYELLTGQTPYSADENKIEPMRSFDLALKHADPKVHPEEISVLNPNVPTDLIDIVRKMIQKDPDYRHLSYEELLEHIERVLRGLIVRGIHEREGSDR